MIPGTLSEYIPKSWFHPRGIYKVIADITPRLPDVSGSLFLTFTIDQTQFSTPEGAFDYARNRLRKLFFHLRRGVNWESKRYQIDSPYCVKVEFHENGWPHFHVIFLTKRFLPGGLLNHLWEFGRTNIKRISNDDFHYLLKYVTKGGEIPDWVLKRDRIRIFQTSRGFYAVPRTQYPRKAPTKKSEAESTRRAITIGDRLARWETKAVFKDDYRRFRTYALSVPFPVMLSETILNVALSGRYQGGGKIRLRDVSEVLELKPYIK